MAADEVLLRCEESKGPMLRFYLWAEPTVSLGYFESISSVAPDSMGLVAPVRRWTGGGVVRHGSDFTYSLIVPASALPGRRAREVYQGVHGLICRVLREAGIPAEIVEGGSRGGSGECFSNPVSCDVMLEGSKVAGAGQRWAREGLLHQGSIQGVALPEDFRPRMAAAFADQTSERVDLLDMLEPDITSLAQRRYASEDWLHRVP